MVKYNRLSNNDLFAVLEEWDRLLQGRVHLIACGGTALTLQGIKDSTLDVDFVVPVEAEHDRLLRFLKDLGYKSASGHGWRRGDGPVIDLFRGARVFTTGLLDSPLDPGRHIEIRKFRRITLGALNDLDLVISKMFRGTEADLEDCLSLIRARGEAFDAAALEARYRETAKYEVAEDRVLRNLDALLHRLEDR